MDGDPQRKRRPSSTTTSTTTGTTISSSPADSSGSSSSQPPVPERGQDTASVAPPKDGTLRAQLFVYVTKQAVRVPTKDDEDLASLDPVEASEAARPRMPVPVHEHSQVHVIAGTIITRILGYGYITLQATTPSGTATAMRAMVAARRRLFTKKESDLAAIVSVVQPSGSGPHRNGHPVRFELVRCEKAEEGESGEKRYLRPPRVVVAPRDSSSDGDLPVSESPVSEPPAE